MPSSSAPSSQSSHQHIGFVSTSRADAGVYESIIEHLAALNHRQLLVFAGGTHLAGRFGRTIDQFPKHARVRIIPVDHHVEGDAAVDVAASAGRAMGAFSRAFADERPDLLFVLGDRTEMLAAALAATIHCIPLLHLHGGESTAGAYDDACRHALTKLAHVHFAALPQYAARIIAMHEHPSRVHTVGAPAIDRLRQFKPETIQELSTAIGLDFSKPTYVIVFHVETLAPIPPAEQIAALLKSLENMDANLMFVGSNADVGHAAIDEAVLAFMTHRPRARRVASLTPHRFWSSLSHARALIGNSSAGIIEAAAFRIPVVNIGDRQKGRVQPANILNAPFDAGAINSAIQKAVSPEFRTALRSLANPYDLGPGAVAERIAAVIDRLPSRDTLICKSSPL